jgi:hypothetical protein
LVAVLPARKLLVLSGFARNSNCSHHCRQNNWRRFDKPLVPLAVALRSMLAETEIKIATAAPAEKGRLQQRAECCVNGSLRGIADPFVI